MRGDRYRNRRGLTGSFLGHTTIMPRGVRSIRLGISRVEDWMVSPLDLFLRVGGVNVIVVLDRTVNIQISRINEAICLAGSGS